jgi:large subunit ribosomal protein L13
MKTWVPKSADIAAPKKWFVVDADGVTLGRLCTRVANLLTGKNKPTWTPHADMGDHVIVINASKVKLTGKKLSDKIYYYHSRFPGSLRQRTAGERLKRRPERLVEDAIRGMLPKTKLGRKMFKKLKVYADAEHPHQAQQPEVVVVENLR